jgi:hypothetical protein
MPRIPHNSEPLFDAGTQKINDNWFRYLDDIARLDRYTVAKLPPAPTAGIGARGLVTDANATTFASVVAAGGSNVVPVYSDGTDWRIG